MDSKVKEKVKDCNSNILWPLWAHSGQTQRAPVTCSDAAGARGGGNPGAFLSNWWEPLLKGALECCGINTELAGCCFYRQVLAVTRKHSRTRVAFGSWWGFDLSTLTFDYFAIL